VKYKYGPPEPSEEPESGWWICHTCREHLVEIAPYRPRKNTCPEVVECDVCKDKRHAA